jgi:hypothetical protein
MPVKLSDLRWKSMKSDRELIELAKTKTLETIAEQFN